MSKNVLLINPEKIIAGTMLAKHSTEVSYEQVKEAKEYVLKKYSEKGETATSFFSEIALNDANRKYNYPFEFGENSISLRSGVNFEFLNKKILIYCPQEVISWIKEKVAIKQDKLK